jgi:hypothetical protein
VALPFTVEPFDPCRQRLLAMRTGNRYLRHGAVLMSRYPSGTLDA